MLPLTTPNRFLKRLIKSGLSLLTLIGLWICFFESTGPSLDIRKSQQVTHREQKDAVLPATMIFGESRIRWWWAGRCVDAPSGASLTTQFCATSSRQLFSLETDGLMRFIPTGECVTLSAGSSRLKLGNCAYAIKFWLKDVSYLQTKVNGEIKCVSPVAPDDDTTPHEEPCLKSPIHLTDCHETASRITIVEEHQFQESRRLLGEAPMPEGDDPCNFRACSFNGPLQPVSPIKTGTRCKDLSKCLTVAIKTARRPELILRMAESIRKEKGFDLPIVAYDDGPDDYREELQQKFDEYPLLRYLVSKTSRDVGIAEGRNLAVAEVQTKYVLVTDDDMVFVGSSNIERMVEMLDTTDVSLVGGRCIGCGDFSGFLEFGTFGGELPKMAHYMGSCSKANRTVTNFPDCYSCELPTNVFIARTDVLRNIGGWSPELKIIEHKDLFIRLKAARKKVAICPNVKLFHHSQNSDEQSEEYIKKRSRGHYRYNSLLFNRWNIQAIFSTGNFKSDEKGIVSINEKRTDRGRC